tara:strand:- start:4641 stop:5243 length:603 start_codon:yes stop_codon:yes gene_type:complete
MASKRDYANAFALEVKKLKKSNPNELSTILSSIMGKTVNSANFTPNQIALTVLVSGDKAALGALYFLMQNNNNKFLGTNGEDPDPFASSWTIDTGSGLNSDLDGNLVDGVDAPTTSGGGSSLLNDIFKGLTDSIPKFVDIFGNYVKNKNNTGDDATTNPNIPDIVITPPDNKLSTGAWIGIGIGVAAVVGGFIYLAKRKK